LLSFSQLTFFSRHFLSCPGAGLLEGKKIVGSCFCCCLFLVAVVVAGAAVAVVVAGAAVAVKS
jgi:hypothetical protein